MTPTRVPPSISYRMNPHTGSWERKDEDEDEDVLTTDAVDDDVCGAEMTDGSICERNPEECSYHA